MTDLVDQFTHRLGRYFDELAAVNLVNADLNLSTEHSELMLTFQVRLNRLGNNFRLGSTESSREFCQG